MNIDGDVNINTGNINSGNRAGKWQHQPERRGNVGYRNNATKAKYSGGSNRNGIDRSTARGYDRGNQGSAKRNVPKTTQRAKQTPRASGARQPAKRDVDLKRPKTRATSKPAQGAESQPRRLRNRRPKRRRGRRRPLRPGRTRVQAPSSSPTASWTRPRASVAPRAGPAEPKRPEKAVVASAGGADRLHWESRCSVNNTYTATVCELSGRERTP